MNMQVFVVTSPNFYNIETSIRWKYAPIVVKFASILDAIMIWNISKPTSLFRFTHGSNGMYLSTWHTNPTNHREVLSHEKYSTLFFVCSNTSRMPPSCVSLLIGTTWSLSLAHLTDTLRCLAFPPTYLVLHGLRAINLIEASPPLFAKSCWYQF